MPEQRNFWTNNSSGIFGFVSNMFSPLWQTISDKRNFKYQQQMAEEQNRRQLEWWNMQNEYNSPKAQIERMTAAGLNPNLAYGNLQSSNAGDVGTPTTAAQQYNVDYAGAMSKGLSDMISLLQGFETLKQERIKTRKDAADLINPDFGIDGMLPDNIQSYEDYVRWLRRATLAKESWNLENRSLLPALTNEKWRALQLKNDFTIKANPLRIRNLNLLNHKIDEDTKLVIKRRTMQDLINDWYVPNQIFNMVTKGISTLGDILIPWNKLKMLPKLMKRK